MHLLADECCPRAIVSRLRAAGHDVRYAAESDRRADDTALLAIAETEGRIIITEDFDFGDLLIRDQHKAPGVVIIFLPRLLPDERAERLAQLLSSASFSPVGALTIVEAKRVRQRPIPPR
jgi:predicted nuclease of predicted toxin-antitoxin system